MSAGVMLVVKNSIRWVIKWLLTSAVGKAIIATSVKLGALAFLLLALAAAELLPRSPFRFAIAILAVMNYQIPYFRYINAFIPFAEIMSMAVAWLYCVMLFHGLKVIFRNARVIK